MNCSTIRRLHRDQRGQTTIEWVLLLAFFVLPMIYVFQVLLAVIGEHYRLVTFMSTLPLP
ncbi:MAG: hypothetical protein LLG01_10900 [Planctomycetaceae bacterium]|nr:hypothetical protein [Planctomycetaceae bacterium]